MTRVSYLVQSDFDRLEDWCRLVYRIFGRPPSLVGSAKERTDYRDVDVRLVLPDEQFDVLSRGHLDSIRFLNRALSVWGQVETGLPIDFQIQRMTEADAEFGGRPFSPMGVRDWKIVPTSGVPKAVTPDHGMTVEYTSCGDHWHAFRRDADLDATLPFEGPSFASQEAAEKAVSDYASAPSAPIEAERVTHLVHRLLQTPTDQYLLFGDRLNDVGVAYWEWGQAIQDRSEPNGDPV